MIDAALSVLVLGVVLVALITDVGVVVAWLLRRRASRIP